ncbi:SMP-30/gluconolactonase/LRE family protein [Fibrella forsythiae]|uniref:SMP-30/gluconolactonase/LRE family protein n=1 Tax=Fibrella forsythiae TaxID=2817061 RepID=A0ABS3JKX5_9BACT|nr:SMP-30/gluconolactonase/LRE family protein [Fibrella forsythiae]MBO0950659.1 SMP-30/gluconolactonase/LRE family protein [Fibrella forsythiae]
MQINSFFAGNLQLGEGIYVDERHNHVWWVDITERRIYRSNLAGNELHVWQTPELVGFVLPHPDGERYWLGLKSGPHAARLIEQRPVELERLATVDADSATIRVNDGSLSADGQSLYVTTMDMDVERPLGRLLCYDQRGHATELSTNFIISNGPAVSAGKQAVYVAESEGHEGRQKGVYRIDLQGTTPIESLLIEWPYEGSPDGVSTGESGTLWVGTYGGNHIRQFTTGGQLLRTIELPALNVTKVASAGTTLYVTSAADGVSDEKRRQYPLTGHVLILDDVE